MSKTITVELFSCPAAGEDCPSEGYLVLHPCCDSAPVQPGDTMLSIDELKSAGFTVVVVGEENEEPAEHELAA